MQGSVFRNKGLGSDNILADSAKTSSYFMDIEPLITKSRMPDKTNEMRLSRGSDKPVESVHYHKAELELAALRYAGLDCSDRVLDLGSANGTLGFTLVPWLKGGTYYGVQVNRPILAKDKSQIRKHKGARTKLKWVVSHNYEFSDVEDNSVDVVAAFSVFPRLTQEATFNCLLNLRRVVRPGGILVFSHLLIDESEHARKLLVEKCRYGSELSSRMGSSGISDNRNLFTTRSFMDTMSELSGWTISRWIRHDDACLLLDDSTDHSGEPVSFGQSICILANEPAM